MADSTSMAASATRNNPHTKSAAPPSSEADKFQVFEQWLRVNGAQFPLLELRKYDAPQSKEDDLRRLSRRPADDEAEEKKDGGGSLQEGGIQEGGIRSQSEGVALMSLDGGDGRKGPARGGAAGGEEDDGSREMRGVHARTAIPPQTVCVSIPKACLITVEMGQATPIGRKILQSDLELDAPKHIFLMIYLLWDRRLHGSESFFAPYYDILPRSLRNMPIFWTDEELALLEGSHLLVQIADRAEAIREDYEAIRAVAPELGAVATLEEFQWARMIVCSRNFGLLVNGHRTSALVPHADMLNHLRPRETKWTFCEETQCFTITTLRGIARGSQVYDSYGQKCNHRFLLNYGFCVENNVEADGFCPNEVPLELGLDLADCLELDGGGGKRGADLWEKKLAFWSRGETAAGGGGSRGPFGFGEGGGMGTSAGAGFHALAAAVAGVSTSTRGTSAAAAAALSSSTDIVRSVASMNDATTTSALAEAVGGGRRSPAPTSARLSATYDALRTRAAACPVKRVRVCVSNNENTRVLFSMLRVLACDAAELDRIAGPAAGGRLGGAAPFYAGGPGAAAQRLFGVAGAAAHGAAGAPRTCRDVRYPVNLRNERRAMRLLLEATSAALAGYPASLARDAADLRDEAAYPQYSNRRNAKLQVRGEKEVLHHFALWARTAMHVIDVVMDEVGAERRRIAAAGASAARRGGAGKPRRNGSAGDLRGVDPEEELGYDYVIQAMEEDDDCHMTILRYCSDVLGAVRRDELNRIASGAIRSGA